MAHPHVTLRNGIEMPMLGFGTWELRREAERAVAMALETGYRHIDTAAMYRNEAAVGRAVRASGVARSEVFVTTKIWNSDHGYARSRKALDRSRRELDLDPIDLVLIHWPGGRDRLETWRMLEERLADGTIRAIGVSNYGPADLDRLLQVAEVVPLVNQVEFNPLVYRRTRPLLDRCNELGIQLTAWRPLIKGRHLDHPEIVGVADRHSRTPAQVLLRWAIQHRVVPLPKSAHEDRIRSNSQVFDFELTESDMAVLDELA